MKFKVEYSTTCGIWGPHGVRTIKIPKYVRQGYVGLVEYFRWKIARLIGWDPSSVIILEYWRDG